jgi:non-canonical purine NTP pyrophosphatase (RdgB/HAM1 family)
MKLTFVTSNQAKLAEVRSVLEPEGIMVESANFCFWEPDGGTVQEVALAKLRQVEELWENVLVDDAGLYLDAYPNFPGVLSKRIFQMIGYRGLHKLLIGETRKARFEGAIALSVGRVQKVFIGQTEGEISSFDPYHLHVNREHSFPYDPIFIPQGEEQVLEKLEPHKKLFYSYRRKALSQLVEWWKGENR